MEKTKKIIVTGARGMLGHVLCETLRDFFIVEGIDKAELDITDEARVKAFLSGSCADALVHCAAATAVDRAEDEPEQTYTINALGARAVARGLSGTRCLYAYISTDYVFDGMRATPYKEEDIPHPLNVYGATKLAGERFAQEHPHHVIIRTSWLFGPGGPNFIKTISLAAREGRPLRVVNDQVGSPTYTRDLARAIGDMLHIYFRKGALENVYHVTGKGYCSWYELACAITQTLGLTVQIDPVPSSEFARKAQRPKNSRLSNERFHALTGYYLPAWQDALRNYLQGTL